MSHEIFEEQSSEWWNESDGPFKLLHKLNPIRLKYIKDCILQYNTELKNLKAIDIGCGGGILTIPMARMGMEIHGLDPGKKNIEIAKKTSLEANLNIKYYADYLENISNSHTHKEQYDIVTCMEVLEHIDDYKLFLMHLCKLVKPGGLLFVSTINRTIKSFSHAIIFAEYLAKIVPKGTHEWKKFIKPTELVNVATACDLTLENLVGLELNPLKSEWSISENVSINYMMCLRKRII